MRRALTLALALFGLPASALALEPFTAEYTADWQPMPVSGSATRQLEKAADGSWTLRFKASMLVAGINEESTFRYDNKRFVPLSYRFERSGMGKSKKIAHDFDWKAQQVTGNDRGTPVKLVLKSGILDKSTYQLALQEDVAAGKKSVSYQVLDGDDIETYDFRVLGEEPVQTEAGQITAIKVERVRDPTKTNRQTVMWFAKDWDYLLVRLHQKEKDGKEYQIMLKDGTVGARHVQGK
ncbi:MAG TPA: DUF3108 domain-containing protein [Pseudomonas sp.]|nr:DUF3108 domain-containing protein [Pseudomonas sp.]